MENPLLPREWQWLEVSVVGLKEGCQIKLKREKQNGDSDNKWKDLTQFVCDKHS